MLVLGDVAFGLNAFEKLRELKGVKRLVLGNHDNYPAARYLEIFNSLHGSLTIDRCLFTHVPVHPSQFARFIGNIHGHLHHKRLEDPRYICVSAEQTDFTPVGLTDLIAQLKTHHHETKAV